MKLQQKNYLIAGVLSGIAGIFLIYKNSIGKYIDPWMSRHSHYKGHMSYWVVVIGIAMILAGILLSIVAFSKPSPQNSTVDSN